MNLALASWHSYPSIFAVGHHAAHDILLDTVVVEEKIDGSQFSFGVFDEREPGIYPAVYDQDTFTLRCRSKGAQLNIIAPEHMFAKAVAVVQEIKNELVLGWTYRGEYLVKPKHNALAYDRTPYRNIIIFDINTGHEEYLDPAAKKIEANRVGLEVVPVLYHGPGLELSHDHLRNMLDNTVSVLGGQKIEGVVIKNYERFVAGGGAMFAKFVSEAYKEVHSAERKRENPTTGDIIQQIISDYRTPARYQKALQHLSEAGKTEGTLRDIGLLIREIPEDIKRECYDEIAGRLFKYAWPHIARGVCGGVALWYKDVLLKRQFEKDLTEPVITPEGEALLQEIFGEEKEEHEL